MHTFYITFYITHCQFYKDLKKTWDIRDISRYIEGHVSDSPSVLFSCVIRCRWVENWGVCFFHAITYFYSRPNFSLYKKFF